MICEGSHQVGRNSASSPVGRERLMGYLNPDGPHLQSDSDLQERGAGTVMVLGLLVAFAIAIMGIMAIGDVVATRDRSQNVADVAALAGAEELRRGGAAAACTKAQEVALRNQRNVSGCEVVGEHVVVVIQAKAAMSGYSMEVRARAGPADKPP